MIYFNSPHKFGIDGEEFSGVEDIFPSPGVVSWNSCKQGLERGFQSPLCHTVHGDGASPLVAHKDQQMALHLPYRQAFCFWTLKENHYYEEHFTDWIREVPSSGGFHTLTQQTLFSRRDSKYPF